MMRIIPAMTPRFNLRQLLKMHLSIAVRLSERLQYKLEEINNNELQ
jgi:hypothetical protein